MTHHAYCGRTAGRQRPLGTKGGIGMITVKTSIINLGLLAVLIGVGMPAYSAGGADGSGGGSSDEMGVNEIRNDILKWINGGGARGFTTWPVGVTYEKYVKSMTEILQPGAVVVGFVTTEQQRNAKNPEDKVIVDGAYKDCRSFRSVRDKKLHILCNTDRYPIGGTDQYRLIHHEYAVLAKVEFNDGAYSDYTLSDQITKDLYPQKVYRLRIPSQNNQCEDINVGEKEGYPEFAKLRNAFERSHTPVNPGSIGSFGVNHQDSGDKSSLCYMTDESGLSIERWQLFSRVEITAGGRKFRKEIPIVSVWDGTGGACKGRYQITKDDLIVYCEAGYAGAQMRFKIDKDGDLVFKLKIENRKCPGSYYNYYGYCEPKKTWTVRTMEP